jgi:uncharacterized protein
VTSHWLDMKVRGSISLDCGRCLDKLTGAFEVRVRLLLEQKDEQGLEWIDDEDQGVEEYLVRVGPDVTDVPLEHPIAEQILLNYNLHPMPSLDEKKRCLQCGRTAFSPEPQVRKDRVDPRWEKLQTLKKPEAGDGKK